MWIVFSCRLVYFSLESVSLPRNGPESISLLPFIQLLHESVIRKKILPCRASNCEGGKKKRRRSSVVSSRDRFKDYVATKKNTRTHTHTHKRDDNYARGVIRLSRTVELDGDNAFKFV